MRGRKPNPQLNTLGAGTFHQPGTINVEPTPPDWLSEDAMKEWERLIPLLTKLGLTNEIDAQALAILCHSMAEYIRLTIDIAKEGDIITYSNKMQGPNHKHRMKDKAFDQINKLLSIFGISPTARARLTLNPEVAIDELDEFIKG